MRKLAIALMVGGGLGLVIGNSGSSEAAMGTKQSQENMSLVEQAKKKGKKYRVCTEDWWLGKCCTDHTGKQVCQGIWK